MFLMVTKTECLIGKVRAEAGCGRQASGENCQCVSWHSKSTLRFQPWSAESIQAQSAQSASVIRSSFAAQLSDTALNWLTSSTRDQRADAVAQGERRLQRPQGVLDPARVKQLKADGLGPTEIAHAEDRASVGVSSVGERRPLMTAGGDVRRALGRPTARHRIRAAIIRRVGRIRAAPLRCLEDGFRPNGRAW